MLPIESAPLARQSAPHNLNKASIYNNENEGINCCGTKNYGRYSEAINCQLAATVSSFILMTCAEAKWNIHN